MNEVNQIHVGCAGWNLPRDHWPLIAADGTHLQRYASQLTAVEINSSFYRPHRPQTYLRWAQSVPAAFRFSVKMPKLVTHVQRLQGCERSLRQRYAGPVVLEPRHESWLDANALMIEQKIGRVAADPSPITGGDRPGGWPGIRYWRWHGSPRIYHSDYEQSRLEALTQQVRNAEQAGAVSWCIFEITASGFAVGNALTLRALPGRNERMS
ncbi:DUF72 domain-containing protein [Pseudomonas sp. LB3P81]